MRFGFQVSFFFEFSRMVYLYLFIKNYFSLNLIGTTNLANRVYIMTSNPIIEANELKEIINV
jgi:hypothetical protein